MRREFAEHSGTACADVTENLALLVRPHAAQAVEEFLSVLSEDIGDFQPMFGHGRLCSSSSAMGERDSPSNGLRVAWIRRVET